MIFQSNPGFIFHDSRGFEAGGVDELQKVKTFVSERSKAKKLVDQVHIIWYGCCYSGCAMEIFSLDFKGTASQWMIPGQLQMQRSNSSRDLGQGKVRRDCKYSEILMLVLVPVIVVFTKCEALELKAIEILQQEQLSFDDAAKGAPEYAKKHLWNAHLILENHKYPPQGHVYLKGQPLLGPSSQHNLTEQSEMEKLNTDCKDLVECTASVLDSETLQAIFVSTQQANLELSMKYAIR